MVELAWHRAEACCSTAAAVCFVEAGLHKANADAAAKEDRFRLDALEVKHALARGCALVVEEGYVWEWGVGRRWVVCCSAVLLRCAELFIPARDYP